MLFLEMVICGAGKRTDIAFSPLFFPRLYKQKQLYRIGILFDI